MDDIDKKTESLKVEEQKEVINRPTALGSMKISLFDNHVSASVKENFDYMKEKHSFFILDVDCLVDLKGIFNYIAERIHHGNMCLFCSK